jgi:HNH endonuclease
MRRMSATTLDEIWKVIPGLDMYEASTHGRQRCAKEPSIIRGCINPYGYHQVWLQQVKRHHLVHRLVLRAHVPNPEQKETVSHIDGVKLNNRLQNLEWASHLENMRHAFATGLIGTERRIRQISREGVTIATYRSQREAAFRTGIRQGDISRVANGHRSTAGGFKWEFF